MSVEMRSDDGVVCLLCQRSEETTVTGPLSTKCCLVTKSSATAHQNCLLYSSGIYCQDSPEFDDLFGFAVEDVRKEVKRGNSLRCNGCKKTCATVGCEVKECKRSYHFPCALENGAEAIADVKKEKYQMLCKEHKELEIKSDTPGPSRRKGDTSKPPTKCSTKRKLKSNGRQDGVPSKVKFKRQISSDSAMLQPGVFCDCCEGKIFGTRYKCTVCPDYDLCSGCQSTGLHEEHGLRSIPLPDDDDISSQSLTMFAPIECDDQEDSNAKINTQETQIHRNYSENDSTSGIAGNDAKCQSQDGCEDSNETDISDADSVRLLLPVTICMESDSSQMTGCSLSSQSFHHSLGSTHNPDPQTQSPSGPHASSTDPADHPHSPVDARASSPNSLHSPSFSVSLLSVPKPKIDSASFWKDFNEAGRTKAIFSDFLDELNDISNRIQSNQASQEDYDMALRVMEASGSLTVLVAKQDEEIKKKKVQMQIEVQIEEAAMKRIMSAMAHHNT